MSYVMASWAFQRYLPPQRYGKFLSRKLTGQELDSHVPSNALRGHRAGSGSRPLPQSVQYVKTASLQQSDCYLHLHSLRAVEIA